MDSNEHLIQAGFVLCLAENYFVDLWRKLIYNATCTNNQYWGDS